MESVTTILALILVLLPTLYFVDYFIRWRKFVGTINKIPGPKSYPLFGSVDLLDTTRETRVERENELKEKYGLIYRTWIGSKPFINVLKAEYAEGLMKDTQNITKSENIQFFSEWLGNSVLFNTGSAWHLRRKLLTPSFHFKILEDFSTVFIQKSEMLVHKLEELSKCGDYIDIFTTVKLCGLDIICKTAMGIELNSMEDCNKKYIECIGLIAALGSKRLLSPWLHNDFIFKRTKLGKEYYEVLRYLHDFTDNVIQEKKKQMKDQPKVEESNDVGTKKRLAFLDLLLEASDNGKLLSDEDIKNEVDTFMFAGHDTTTVATCWFLFIIGNHPKIQERIHEELDGLFHGEDRPITVSDTKHLKYLDMCIKEALRLYPSAPRIGRHITHPINIGGYEIPSGSNVRIKIYQIHRDPEYFPEPDKFNPDHFLPENCSKRHPFAYIPFSAGLRNCIGQKFAQLEEKILLATILRRFKITSLLKPEEMKVFHEIILKPQTGIKIKLEPRQKKI